MLVDGFSGVSPGVDVYIDPANTADTSSTTSGLTQTPTQGSTQVQADRELNPATISATTTVQIEVPAGVTTLAGIDIAVATTVASDAANIWTFSAANTGANGTGTTALLAATAANTTNSTGGFGLTANVPQALALSATPANLVVTPGQILTFTATKSSSAANLVTPVIHFNFTGAIASAPRKVGTGWSATKIMFD